MSTPFSREEQEERERIAYLLDALLAIAAVELAKERRAEAKPIVLERKPVSEHWLKKAS